LEHWHIQPRRSQQNGKVERSHRSDNEEFWSRVSFGSVDEVEVALYAWEQRYNRERFSVTLSGGRQPSDFAIAA
jgi:transposase InsO family protein